MAGATNVGKVSRYFGPPTDPSLDASRDNDHLTRWQGGIGWDDAALIVVAFALIVSSYAWALGVWPFA